MQKHANGEMKKNRVSKLKKNIPIVTPLILLFVFLPLTINSAYAVTKPCPQYKRQISEALQTCDFEKLLELERSLKKSECGQAQEQIKEAKCQYFTDCAIPDLNQAYIDCDLKTVLEIEKKILANLSDCTDFIIIKEKILGMKCLYFESCVKKELDAALEACNWERIFELEEFMRSDVLRDCPDYAGMMAKIKEYRCNSFNLCMMKELKKAKKNCDLEKIMEIDDFLKQNLGDCANIGWMDSKVSQAKCDYGVRCGKQFRKEFASSKCQPNKLKRLKDLMRLEEWKQCTPYQYQILNNLIRKMECGYLDNCAGAEFKRQQDECDLEDLLQLDSRLDSCQVQARLKDVIRKKKPEIIKNCIQKRLKQAVDNCDFPAIQQWEKFLGDKVMRDFPYQETLKDLVVEGKYSYFKNCLKVQLDNGVTNCNQRQIKKTAKRITRELAGHPKQETIRRAIEDSECLYFLSCTQRKLDDAVENCNYEEIREIKELSRQEEIKYCPGYEDVEHGIPNALQLYFYNCAQKKLYKAYENCDWDGILREEKLVEDELKFYPDYRKIRVVVLEVKCSHFMSCRKDELDKAVALKDKTKLLEFKQLINRELGACPNYPTLSRIIQEALDEIK